MEKDLLLLDEELLLELLDEWDRGLGPRGEVLLLLNEELADERLELGSPVELSRMPVVGRRGGGLDGNGAVVHVPQVPRVEEGEGGED